MKVWIVYIAVFALGVCLLPMLALNFHVSPQAEKTEVQIHAPSNQPNRDDQRPSSAMPEKALEEDEAATAERDLPVMGEGEAFFQILDQTTGQVVEVPVRDYVRGAVAAEMPVEFHLEALKAQAVAAHTYALHHHMVQQTSPDPLLEGADFEADPSNFKVYITEAQAKDFYGEQADFYWAKICEAADSVLDYVVTYEEEPIVAAYHAISAGQTEDASNVWIGSAPYLQPTESEGDLLAPDYQTQYTISADELQTELMHAYPELVLSEDPAGWFGGEERSESGYVTDIEIGDQIIHGKELREILGLRSHHFTVSYQNGIFLFDVYGYGHGVGLSQYGADFLARQGYTFEQILNKYYTDAAIVRLHLPEGV